MTFAINPVWPAEDTESNEMDRGDLIAHIYSFGIPVRLELATQCACKTQESLAFAQRSDCKTCGGLGWEYHSGVDTRAIVTPMDRNPKNLRAFGAWAMGRATITLHPDQTPGNRDRVTLLTGRLRVSEFMTRGTGAVDVPRHPIVPQIIETSDVDDVTRGVIHLRLTDADDGTVGPVRVEGIDFAVTEAGAIDWTLGIGLDTAPEEGQGYVVDFFTRPRYVIESMPHVIRASRVKDNRPARVTEYLPTETIGVLDSIGGERFTPE